MELGKVPPHDIEAEQAILGCMLTDRDSVISAIEVLKEDAFYREDNKAIYSAILALYAKSEPIDIITVKAELIENGNFERVGGLEYLASLPERVPTTANVEKYIKIITHNNQIDLPQNLRKNTYFFKKQSIFNYKNTIQKLTQSSSKNSYF